MNDKGLEGLLHEWRDRANEPEYKLHREWAIDQCTEEAQPFVDRLKDVESKLRDDAHEMASPFYSKTPAEPDWNYVAKAFLEIANELFGIIHGSEQESERWVTKRFGGA